jgi:CBS domain-containing protein
MTSPAECLSDGDTLVDAAKALARSDVGSMPVKDAGGHLVGVITDRDLVVRGLAEGCDPASTMVRDIASRDVVTVSVDDSAEAVAQVLADHQIRRVPVLDGGRLAGIVSQADVALGMSKPAVANVVRAISEEEGSEAPKVAESPPTDSIPGI